MPKLNSKPTLPAYKRPFEQKDFRGYFTWTDRLSEQLGGSLYHACHREELDTILATDELGLRSTWKIHLPGHERAWQAKGVWCGLNNFGARGNFYGPCLLTFPIAVLQGRQFMVFRRNNDGRDRVFFVQHQSPLPVFSFDDDSCMISRRIVNPGHYFEKIGTEYSLKSGSIYDLVLTEPLALDECQVYGANHPHCIPAKCGRSESHLSQSAVKKAGLKRARNLIRQSPEIQKLLSTIPSLTVDDLLPN